MPGPGAFSPESVPDVEVKLTTRGELIVAEREISTWYRDAPPTAFHAKDIARSCEPVTRMPLGAATGPLPAASLEATVSRSPPVTHV